MVKKGNIMDDFDAIRFVRARNAIVPIGQAESTLDIEVELYDKNLVLTSKWDKLPVLESFQIVPENARAVFTTLNASGVAVSTTVLDIYNCEEDDIDDDHRIGSAVMLLTHNGGAPTNIMFTTMDVDYNVPLRNKITLRVNQAFNGNVAGADFPADSLGFKVFANIDYIHMSAEKLKDWILKELFIDQ